MQRSSVKGGEGRCNTGARESAYGESSIEAKYCERDARIIRCAENRVSSSSSDSELWGCSVSTV